MPSVAITRPYEAVYIVDPAMGEEQIATTTNRYKQIVETNGGTVAKVDVWERRKLAYAIKGRTEGIYVVMQFSGPASAESELRRIFQISEDQIRAMIVRQDEDSASPLAGEGEAVAAVPASQPAPVAAAPIVADAPASVAPAVVDTPDAVPSTVQDAPTAASPDTEPAPVAVTEAAAPALAPEQAPTE